MNTSLDILTDVKDCKFLKFYHTQDGNTIIINLIPDLVVVDCSKCEEELAKYHIIVVGLDESCDIVASLCKSCYKEVERLCSLNIPTRVLH